jgi:hypothetical protein
MSNRYPAECYSCGNIVDRETGSLYNKNGKWVVFHRGCDSMPSREEEEIGFSDGWAQPPKADVYKRLDEIDEMVKNLLTLHVDKQKKDKDMDELRKSIVNFKIKFEV